MEYTCPDCNGSFQKAQEFCAHFNECHSNESSKTLIPNKQYMSVIFVNIEVIKIGLLKDI